MSNQRPLNVTRYDFEKILTNASEIFSSGASVEPSFLRKEIFRDIAQKIAEFGGLAIDALFPAELPYLVRNCDLAAFDGMAKRREEKRLIAETNTRSPMTPAITVADADAAD